MQTPMERLEHKYERFEKQVSGELPPRKRKAHLLTPAYYERKHNLFERRLRQLERGRPKVRHVPQRPVDRDATPISEAELMALAGAAIAAQRRKK